MKFRHADTPIKAIRSFGLRSDMLLMTPLEYMVCTSTEVDHPARDYRTLYYINGVLAARHLASGAFVPMAAIAWASKGRWACSGTL